MNYIFLFLCLAVIIAAVVFLIPVIAGIIAADVAFRPRRLASSGARQEIMQADSNEIRERIVVNNRAIEERKELFLKSHNPVKWTAVSEDGLALVADYYENPLFNHRYVLIVHGYLSSKELMRKFVPGFFDAGCSIVVPDSRAHGESGGEWTGLGCLEAKDIGSWVKRIAGYDHDARIALFGISCGAASVMISSCTHMQNVRCIIEDCGFTTACDEMKYILKSRVRFPGVGLMKSLRRRLMKKAGFDISAVSPVQSIADAEYPMLFIHGSGDTFVPFSMQSELIGAYKGPFADKLILEGAPHGQSFNTDPGLYMEKTETFLEKYL